MTLDELIANAINNLSDEDCTPITQFLFQLKRGEESKLQELNLLLKAGEPIVSFNDGIVAMKIGDGTTLYNDLPFVSSDTAIIDDVLSITSTHPVQNRVITSALQDIQTTIGNPDNGLIQQINKNTTDILARVTQTEARKFVNNIVYDNITGIFTFTMYDNTTQTVDLPVENTVRDGRYDATTNTLILVLVSGQEIKIPVADLVDIYKGSENAQIQVSIDSGNVINAILKAGSIDESYFTETLQQKLTTLENTGTSNATDIVNIKNSIAGNTQNIETLQTTTSEHNDAINTLQQTVNDLPTEAQLNEAIGTATSAFLTQDEIITLIENIYPPAEGVMF